MDEVGGSKISLVPVPCQSRLTVFSADPGVAGVGVAVGVAGVGVGVGVTGVGVGVGVPATNTIPLPEPCVASLNMEFSNVSKPSG